MELVKSSAVLRHVRLTVAGILTFVALIGAATARSSHAHVEPGDHLHSHDHSHDGHTHTHWHSHPPHEDHPAQQEDGDHHEIAGGHEGADVVLTVAPLTQRHDRRPAGGKAMCFLATGGSLVNTEAPDPPPPKRPPRPPTSQDDVLHLRTVVLLT